jgi:thiol-disulfide isomerase/thioredoxin
MSFDRPRSAKTLFGVCLLCASTFLASCAGGDSNDTKNTPVLTGPPSTTFPMPPPSGKSLGELGWQLADGQRNQFSQYHGSILILDFYATWCQPCQKSIPQLVQLQKTYKDQGLRVVGLNVGGPEDWPKVADFARELKISYTLAVPEDELSSFLLTDSQEIPQTFVFDREGRLIQRLIGFGDGDADLIRRAVETALAGK